MKIKTTLAAMLFTAVLFFQCSRNDHNENTSAAVDNPGKDTTEAGRKDRSIDRLTDIYRRNIDIIMASETAADKAVAYEVTRLANILRESHTQMNVEIEELSRELAFDIPFEQTNAEQRKLDKLEEKTQLKLDKEFVKQMKDIHDEQIKACEKLAKDDENDKVKSWAGEALAQMNAHTLVIDSAMNVVKDLKRGDRHGRENNIQDGRDDIHRHKR